jgi:hypothetical protein
MAIKIAATAGVPYPDFPRERRYTFKLVDVFPIAKSEILINGDRCVNICCCCCCC